MKEAEENKSGFPDRTTKRMCCGCCLAPFVLLVVLIVANFGCERYELASVSRLVDEDAIPGTVVFSGSRTDWVHSSNGAYIRKYWLIATDEPNEVRAYAEQIKSNVNGDYYDVEVFDLGEFDSQKFVEGASVDGSRLMLLKVSFGRSPYIFEWWD